MSTCYHMIPNGFTSAMSCRDIGGNGPPPTPSNQLPSHGSQSVQSVKRKLFGDVDHNQTQLDLQRELRQCEDNDRNKYNFDFRCEEPIDSSTSRYKWSQISSNTNIDNKFSTKLCKTSDQSSASQSQSATSSPTEPDSRTDSSTQGLDSPPSATIAPDSQPQPSSSALELMPESSEMHKSVNCLKQKHITDYFDDRKSLNSQRKRSAAQEVSHKDRQTKRHRLECTSAVKQEDSDSNTTTTVTLDVKEDEDSTRSTGTPV